MLEQFDIAALQVHPALLVQAGAVLALAVLRLETLAHAVVRRAFEFGRDELARALVRGFGQQRLAVLVEEAHLAIAQRDLGGDAGRLQAHAVLALDQLERGDAADRHAHQAGATREVAVQVCADPHDAVIDQLQAHVGGLVVGGPHDHAIGGALYRLRVGKRRQQCQRKQVHSHRPHRCNPRQ